jgi:hypothetical protein
MRRCDDPICWPCTHALADTLARIPDLADLLTTAARVVRNTGGDGGRAHYPPLPFDDDLHQFAGELHAMLVACTLELTAARRIPFMPIGHASPAFLGPLPPHLTHLPAGYVATTRDIAAWLRAHIADLRMCDTAGDTCLQLTRALEHGLALAAGPTIPVYRGPCPTVVGIDTRGKLLRCNNRLYAPRGESWVSCRRCHLDHDTTALEARHMADMSQMLFRFNHIQRILRELGEPVTDRTLSMWIRNGKIRPAGWQQPDGTIATHQIRRADPALYQLADVRRVRADSRAVKGSTA